jgi:hypothetical protein
LLDFASPCSRQGEDVAVVLSPWLYRRGFKEALIPSYLVGAPDVSSVFGKFARFLFSHPHSCTAFAAAT